LIGKTRNRWEDNITAPRVTIHKFLYSVQLVENNIPTEYIKLPRVTIHKFLYSVQLVENNIPTEYIKLYSYRERICRINSIH